MSRGLQPRIQLERLEQKHTLYRQNPLFRDTMDPSKWQHRLMRFADWDAKFQLGFIIVMLVVAAVAMMFEGR